jgi:N-acetyl-anhydromuramyl-L-alanine amidase AmpD
MNPMMIADVIPPMSYGDLDLDMRTGIVSGIDVRPFWCIHYGGRLIAPSVIVVHFTAGAGGAKASIGWMNKAGTSSHVVIDRTGGIWQSLPFTKIGYHAGKGDWEGFHNTLNHHSIGIELSNLGPMWLTPKNQYVDSYGREQTDRIPVPMPHRNAGILDVRKIVGEDAYEKIVAHGIKDPNFNICWWEVFPDEQTKALQRLCSLLVTRYPSIKHIIGHDTYARMRKIDPGPALPLEKLVSWMPQGRTILYQDAAERPTYTGSLDTPDYLRNLVTSRRFGAGNTGRDIG